ncbi:putative periplasmic protein [Candidatus Burkholderia verschuerenii]|uniref:Putative periplasmic protein n=1 Tax=Candidatus Burkholderia verschuerenii TaxID=242163 RepID=A0A0L0MAL3_9BURK|nr:lysozyme inhibitor LprI family protein [Candidatus Burkholderia verschuerenii]KND59320.1 putative periplasmic protein [Candidatus Burkholderia verschuerenii]
MRLTLVALLCVSASTWAAQPDCSNAPTQTAMNECVGKSLKAADQKLNETYRTLAAKISKDGAEQLKKTQRAWLAWRDAQCEFDSMGSRDGSIHSMIQAMCVEDLTKAQTKRLDAQMHCQEGDIIGCGGQ